MDDIESTRDHRTAIVTGASRGLGAAVARGLIAVGWRVVVDGRDGDALAAFAASITGDGLVAGDDRAEGSGPRDRLVAVAGDVTDEQHRRELVDAAGSGLGLLVNNAGGLGPSPLPHVSAYPLAALRDLFEVNVVAPLALAQLALPALRENGGTVVNITSDAAVEAYEGWGGYGLTKAALEHLGAVMAVEEPAVRVLGVDPGDLRTDMHQAAFPGEDISDRPRPETAVPALLAVLADRDRRSGRHRLADLATGDETSSSPEAGSGELAS